MQIKETAAEFLDIKLHGAQFVIIGVPHGSIKGPLTVSLLSTKG